jgi:hypothetical protein
MAARLGEAWKSMRFFQLFAFTVLVFLLAPLQLQFQVVGLVLGVLYLNALVVSLTASRYPSWLRWAFWAGWGLAVVPRLAPVGELRLAVLLYGTSRFLAAVLLAGCVAVTLAYVLRGAEVSLDRIFAAIVAYMLLALGFAAAYQAINTLAPASFALPEATDGAHELERLELQLVYFSFVTIATLGYGDITPRLPLAQMLAVLEAVVGQFYVAVIIAWLVSAYAAHRRSRA